MMTKEEIESLPPLNESQVFVLRLLAESLGSDRNRVENFIAKCRCKDRPGETCCVAWAGAADPKSGYGKFSMGDKSAAGNRMVDQAHRASYRLFSGPIPEGLEIDHLCRNRLCVSPAHLEAVDHHTNLMRSNGMATRYASRTHCKRGHELIPENMYYYKGKRAACRLCQAVRDKNRKKRKQ